jgi:uncharacterized membrane protein YsdA (DUF1294 family)
MARPEKWKWLWLIGVLLGGLGALTSVFIKQHKLRQRID